MRVFLGWCVGRGFWEGSGRGGCMGLVMWGLGVLGEGVKIFRGRKNLVCRLGKLIWVEWGKVSFIRVSKVRWKKRGGTSWGESIERVYRGEWWGLIYTYVVTVLVVGGRRLVDGWER